MTSNLVRNIRSQAQSLSAVLSHQRGEGAPALAEAASLLRKKRRIVITGMGASLFASIPLQYALCSLGFEAEAVEAGELLHYRSGSFRDSVLVLVSRSGESVEIVKLLELLKDSNSIIGVSNEPQSVLARDSDISLHIGSLADEMVAIQTYTGSLLTLHLLAGSVAGNCEAGADDAMRCLPAFASLIEDMMHRMSEWDDFLRAGSPVYLIARGPSGASAYEGALLFHEVAKSAAVSMPAASFRHGAVEVVDSHFRGLIFAGDGKTRELNAVLARDVVRFGGSVRVIGPACHSSDSSIQSLDLPPTPESLAPIFEIVPVQVAALRLAELRGIQLGSFRYAPQVTVDETHFTSGRRDAK